MISTQANVAMFRCNGRWLLVGSNGELPVHPNSLFKLSNCRHELHGVTTGLCNRNPPAPGVKAFSIRNSCAIADVNVNRVRCALARLRLSVVAVDFSLFRLKVEPASYRPAFQQSNGQKTSQKHGREGDEEMRPNRGRISNLDSAHQRHACKANEAD